MLRISLNAYIADAYRALPVLPRDHLPWQLTTDIAALLYEYMTSLGPDFTMTDGIAVHRSAVIAASAVIEAPAIVSRDCTIAPHAYVRAGVFADQHVHIGSSCEVKSSYLFHHCALAHLNYVGNALIGAHVNLEAGAVVANHWNERHDKAISVVVDGRAVPTHVTKFGAVLGDGTRMGANAVTSPGTLLPPRSVVKRLELVDQGASVAASDAR
jgi:bifunctional N-acetylglucosamine-1-phosphate-uridyltransferase/glucosamine-1-phosphate-acetyltransferase GlmU-like protein